jgi:hypothetical protein
LVEQANPAPNPDDGGLLTLIDVGGAIAGAVIAVGVAAYGWFGAPSDWDLAHRVASPTLLGFALFLGIFWFRVGSEEGRMLDKIGAGVLPPTPWYATPLIALAGALFGVLFVASLVPPAYCLVLLLIKGLESWNAYVAGRRIDDGIERAFASVTLPEAQTRHISVSRWHEEASVIDRYYFGHPWYQLAVTMTVALGLVATIGAYLSASTDPGLRDFGTVESAVGAVAVILANELAVARWRRVRKREFAKLEVDGPEVVRRHQHYPLGAQLPAIVPPATLLAHAATNEPSDESQDAPSATSPVGVFGKGAASDLGDGSGNASSQTDREE